MLGKKITLLRFVDQFFVEINIEKNPLGTEYDMYHWILLIEIVYLFILHCLSLKDRQN